MSKQKDETAQEDSGVLSSPEIIDDTPAGDEKPPKEHHPFRTFIIIFLIVIVVLALAVVGCGAYLYYDDQEQIQYAPENTTIDGTLEVGGMTRDEVGEALDGLFERGYAGKITLTNGRDSYNISLAKIGMVDTEATVDEVFEPYETDTIERIRNRVTDRIEDTTPSYDVSIVYTLNPKKLKKKVKKLAKKIDTPATDASYTFNEKKLKPVVVKSSEGVKVDVDETVMDIRRAFDGVGVSFAVPIVTETVEPEVTKPGKAIVIDMSACRLSLYKNGKRIRQYPCTPGQPGYPTPTGDWTIVAKDPSPTWYNPGSDWAKSMPDTIPPGESNPLGLRSLELSCGGGIYIHGTTSLSELGTPASHGCIRVANENIVKLYDLVDVGTPVYVR